MSPFLHPPHRCQCTRGFFTLRPCAADAPRSCPQCQRWICDEHWFSGAGGPCCVECAARANDARNDFDDDSPLWFHSYRHRYYTTNRYRPIFVGREVGVYYDPYDVRGFDAAPATDAAGAGDLDDDGAGGLGDS